MASRFWVGGTGNWDAATTTNWAATSGGAGGQSVPTSSDDVTFDTLSNATAYTVTVTAIANCANISFTNPLAGALTFAGSSALNVFGNFTILSTITRTYTGTITFRATATGKTITMNSITLASAITFNGVGGGWTLQDNLVTGNSNALTLVNGTLNTNGKTATFGDLIANSGTNTLTLGASTINCNGTTNGLIFQDSGGTFTFNCGTSTINMGGARLFFSGGNGNTFNNVVATNVTTANGDVTGNSTFANFTINGNVQTRIDSNLTITSTLTFAGTSTISRLLINTSVPGSNFTLTAAIVTLSNTDFQDINGAGAAAPFTGTSLGDCLGNSNITFDTPVDQHWISASGGNWSDVTKWTSRVPLPQDNVFFDNAFGVSQTVTANMARLGKSISWTGATFTTALTFTLSSTTSIFGSLILISGLTLGVGTATLTFEGRSSYTIKSFGLTFDKPITLSGPSGALSLDGDLTMGATRALTVSFGTFSVSASNYIISTGSISMGASGTLTLGTNTHLLQGTGTVFNATSGTITANTATIIINNSSASAKTFTGGNKIYYNLQWTSGSTGTLTISGNNYFNQLYITGTGTGACIITGSNTYQTFKADTPPHSFTITAATNHYLNNWSISGTLGNLMTFISSSAGSAFNLLKPAGVVNADYLSLKDSAASGGAKWFAGTNSSSVSGNSGWIFTAPTSVNGQGNGFFAGF